MTVVMVMENMPQMAATVREGGRTDPTPGTSSYGQQGPAEAWDLREIDCVRSTNDVAGELPAWTAVRANRQTAGRGRHQRAWVSDEGGLWLSAVVPTPGGGRGWAALPLAAGCAVCEVIEDLGVSALRLRWPNDVMIGRRKLAGLLVDRFRPGLAVVGVGLNVFNRPEATDEALEGEVVRLAEVSMAGSVPGLTELARRILSRLRDVADAMGRTGFQAVLPRVNRWWRHAGIVEAETETERVTGAFLGVDEEGRLRIRDRDGRTGEFPAHAIVRLREKIDET